tara:strand:- start:600 stop:1103 length:504 start_codon:yes stop_codon:yes gene_type:complete
MPWGNMRMVTNPCSQWGVFKMLQDNNNNKFSQISILKDKKESRIYSSVSMLSKDISNTNHVLSLGIDLERFLKKQVENYNDFLHELENSIMKSGGTSMLQNSHSKILTKLSKILNISWVSDSIQNPVEIICARSTECPRSKRCDGKKKIKRVSWINQIKSEIIESNQ